MWLIVLLCRQNKFSYPNNRLSDVTVFRIPQWLISKESACKAGATRDKGLIPGLERSLGEGNGNPLQYSCLKISWIGRAWQATVHGIAKSQTWLSNFTFLRIVTNMSCLGSCFPRKQKLYIKGLLENDGPDGDIWLEMALCTTISKEASNLWL